MKNYIIDENRLRELLKAELKLMALENGGVDNWTYHDDSGQDFLNGDFEMNKTAYVKFFNLDEKARPDEFEEFKMNFDFDDIVEFDITAYEEYN